MVLHVVWPLVVALAAQVAPPPASSPADRPITHFFQNLAHDVTSLPSRRTAGLLAAGAVGALAVHPLDDNVHAWALKQPTSSVASFGDVFGDIRVQGTAALATWAVGVLADNRTVAHVGSDLIRAQALNGLLVVPTKVIVNRTRPNGGHWSFPSGHASATFATAAVLHQHFGWRAGAPAVALAVLTSWSDSICAKSGFTVRSSVIDGVTPSFTSRPTSGSLSMRVVPVERVALPST